MTSIEDLTRAPGLVVEIVDALPEDTPPKFEARASGFAKRAEIEHPINRSPSTIAAASVYLTVLLQNQPFSQQEVAEAAGVGPMAIRNCYPEIGLLEGFTVKLNDGSNERLAAEVQDV